MTLVRKFLHSDLTRGEIASLAFFLAQALDAGLTYWGVVTHGHALEANPLLASLMWSIGAGPALASAKLGAACCGMVLHLTKVHRIVAALTLFYVCAALIPWIWVLHTI